MRPSADFVRQLHDYDPTLRVVWAKHTHKYFIEVKAGPQQPSWVREMPNPLGKNARAKDLWLSWQEGYIHVLSVDSKDLTWDIVAPELDLLRVEVKGRAESLNRRLDQYNEQFDAHADRLRDNLNEVGASELYDRLCWDQGRRVSLYNPPDGHAKMEEHEGFRVVDRRHVETP